MDIVVDQVSERGVVRVRYRPTTLSRTLLRPDWLGVWVFDEMLLLGASGIWIVDTDPSAFLSL